MRRTVLLEPATPRKVSSGKSAPPVKQTKATARETGLEIDYTIISGFTNTYTFQGDTTYYLSGPFQIDRGAVFEGGAVLKFTNNGCVDVGDGDAPNGTFETYLYRPVIFTSKDDDSVGTSISGSTGNPLTLSSGTAFFVAGSASPTNLIQNARFSYAGVAVRDPNDDVVEFRDCQFLQCGTNFYTVNPGGLFENVLMSHCGCAVYGAGGAIECQNVTLDGCTTFCRVIPTNTYQAITNGIITDFGGSLSGVILDHCVEESTGSGVFQTVGAGSYYLINSSTNRGAGTTNIDPSLLLDLKAKTTYPPVTNFYGWLTNDYTFFPQAQRDNSGSAVDLGYHYEPIDYAVSFAISNATATVLPGTVIAGMGPNYGIGLFYPGAALNSTGTPTSPNYLIHYNAVQEQSNTNWETSGWAGMVNADTASGDPQPFARCRFTKWSVLAGEPEVYAQDSDALLEFQDCQFYNGDLTFSLSTMLSTNSLFQRVNLSLIGNNSTQFTSNGFWNNLFWNGELGYSHKTNHDAGTWLFRDNLCDQTVIAVTNSSATDIFSNNAYVTNLGRLYTNSSDVVLTESPAYESGALGDYYYPTNQTNLIYQGSQLASAVGLYHYTVTTNNVIEGTNQVSIGFHYVACGPNGLPLDTAGDGTPDYIADSNGNGIYDTGDLQSWTNYTSPNGLTTSAGLQVFTPLH